MVHLLLVRLLLISSAIVYIYFNTIGYTLGRVILASQDFSQRIYSYDDLDFVRASKQIFDYSYSLGKSLSDEKIVRLASRGQQSNAINVVLTSADVAVDGFCTSRCGTHGSSYSASKKSKFAYIWVGNSEIQCPGKCASPFLQPIYGLEDAPLVAPNNGVRVDEIFQVINLASVLAQNLVRNIRL
ncbi:hypothetical protein MKW92_047669 [Papaver armeniacum]|nr:hypothetical protein MKW92_047669 [Papaver armeniacum]